MLKIKLTANLLFVLSVAFVLNACKPMIAAYDQYAYTQTTSIKIDVLNLIDKSNESYFKHQQETEEVVSSINKMKEYERHRTNDQTTSQMWEVIIDSTGEKGLVGRFLTKWKNDTTIKKIIIEDAKPLIGYGFDLIAELESKKLKKNDQSIQTFLHK